MERIYFKSLTDCCDFFKEARRGYSITTWKELAHILNTNRSVLDNYRNRKRCLPENRFLMLLDKVNDDKKSYFLNVIEKRNQNWGRIKGGKITYSKHKEMFELGRLKAIDVNKSKGHNSLSYFDLNLPLSEELCEFVGVVIGDGFTNKYGHHYVTQITGHKLLDFDYYLNTLSPFCKNLFNIKPYINKTNDSLRFTINSKRLFELLTKRFFIPPGKKCYTVTIPKEIMCADKRFISATLRGMFDTDGGVGLDRRKSYAKPYVRLNYTSASKSLMEQVHQILFDYKISHSFNKKENSWLIQINGENNVKLFLSKIGFSNKRHLSKLTHLI